MSGAIPFSIMTRAVMILAWKYLVFFAPFLAVAALLIMVGQTDRFINWLFPDLEWEKNLGWLNIRAERRANTALRWLGYAIYILLGAALYGIAWAAAELPAMDEDWATAPMVLGNLAVLAVCVVAWVLYLGSWLIPKLRAEREEAGLMRFRAQMEELERECEQHPRSRVHSPLRKPRTNGPLVLPGSPEPFLPARGRHWRQPGG